MRKPEKSAKQTRRANRGNVPGCLGMEELAMLMGRNNISESQTKCIRCERSSLRPCERSDCPQLMLTR